MKGIGGGKSSPLYEDENNKTFNKAPQVNNNNNKTSPLEYPPPHPVVYFGFERSRKQAALKKKKKKERGKILLSSPDPSSQSRPRGELHHPHRQTVAPSPARLGALRAPAPSLKRGRRGPGPAGGRRGAHTPDPAAARTVHCKQARGTEPLGSGAAAAAPGVRSETPAQPHSARTHGHTHARTHAFTRIHTLPHTCRDRRIFTLAVDYCGVVGG